MILETKDLIIRKTVFEDLDTFYVWERVPEVTKFFSIKDNQTKEEVLEKYFADKADPSADQFSIFLKKKDGTEKLIGRIVLGDIIEGWKAEIWRIYIGDLAERGKGYGQQSMEAMMKYCFDELKLERLFLDHYTGNPASQLYLKLGFQYEGVLRSNCRKNGILYDVHLMSILKDEYYCDKM
ncbi:MAG: GNAT family N-acetyltransferase [Firmicutes bacterium]|nr:GNAT family N-acetyltransferase [Bacillota bacterium]